MKTIGSRLVSRRLWSSPVTSVTKWWCSGLGVTKTQALVTSDEVPGTFEHDFTNEFFEDPYGTTARMVNENPNSNYYKGALFGYPSIVVLNPEIGNELFGWELTGHGIAVYFPTLLAFFSKGTHMSKFGPDHMKYRKEFAMPFTPNSLSNKYIINIIYNQSFNGYKKLLNQCKESKDNNVDFLNFAREVTFSIGFEYIFGKDIVNECKLDGTYNELYELTDLICNTMMDFDMDMTEGTRFHKAMTAKETKGDIIMEELIKKGTQLFNNNKLNEDTVLYKYLTKTKYVLKKDGNNWDPPKFMNVLSYTIY